MFLSFLGSVYRVLRGFGQGGDRAFSDSVGAPFQGRDPNSVPTGVNNRFRS